MPCPSYSFLQSKRSVISSSTSLLRRPRFCLIEIDCYCFQQVDSLIHGSNHRHLQQRVGYSVYPRAVTLQIDLRQISLTCIFWPRCSHHFANRCSTWLGPLAAPSLKPWRLTSRLVQRWQGPSPYYSQQQQPPSLPLPSPTEHLRPQAVKNTCWAAFLSLGPILAFRCS